MLSGEVGAIVSATPPTYIKLTSICGKLYGIYEESACSDPFPASYGLYISNIGRKTAF
jgi:hypothetical protein